MRQLLGSGNGLDLVIGQAGTGKSTMLGAARAGWESAGYEVIGTAIASRTAAELQASTGIESITMARLLIDLERGDTILTRRHVIVVDEASLVGSRTLDRLQRQVDGARAKLVLVGDNRQLSSIDAGGALRSLSKTLSAHVVELTTNRRQSEVDQEWERQALLQLRNGDIAPAIAAYAAHDRIAIADDVVAAREQLIDRWWSVHATATTAIMAVTRADVAALNEMARQRRREAGELGEELRLASGKEFAVGDRIAFEKNARARLASPDPGGRASTVAIRNGTFATVVAVPGDRADSPPTREGDVLPSQGDVPQGQQGQALVVELASGQHVTLSSQYLEESTSLGYAMTVFRSQGITVDHAFLLGNDTLFQEAGYTALSRGRLSNHLYAVASENPRAEIAHRDEVTGHQDALAGLVDALSRSHEQTMALESLPAAPPVPHHRLMVSAQCLDHGRTASSLGRGMVPALRTRSRPQRRAGPRSPDSGLLASAGLTTTISPTAATTTTGLDCEPRSRPSSFGGSVQEGLSADARRPRRSSTQEPAGPAPHPVSRWQ